MRPPVVVPVLPLPQRLGQLRGAPESDPAVELLRVRPMAALASPVALGAPPGGRPVGDPKDGQSQVESGPNSEPGAVWIR
ncbi:MAG: hypothetical protein HY613_07930 [Candidatus Rokubacteria bacterium]|nr:hypothetical protein [Candidatus Rokubacteria bacterium]